MADASQNAKIIPNICMNAIPNPTPINIEVFPENLSCNLVIQPS